MKRIPSIISLKTKEPSHIYDLFADHGKIGLSYSNQYPKSKLSFIDIREHLVLDIKNNNDSNDLYHFITMDAKQCNFEVHSLILMCGVGGNLVISCLKNYLKNENINSQEFIICVTMHHLEVRKFLRDNNLFLKEIKIASENGHCYEVLLITFNNDYKKIDIFCSKEWSLTNPIHTRYLKSKIKALKDKYLKESWENEVLLKLTNFVYGT